MGRTITRAIAILAFSATACATGCAAGIGESRKETAAIAARIQSDFAQVRSAHETMVGEIERTYATAGSLDLSIDHLDVGQGGVFATCEGGRYYYKTVREGCSYYCSPPDGKIDDRIRTEVRIMGYLEDAVLRAFDASPPFLSIILYGVMEPTSIAIMYPWFDVVSLFPPGLDFGVFEWFRRGLESKSDKGAWSALPFVDLAAGWVMDLSSPVHAEGRIKGVAVTGVRMSAAGRRYLDGAGTAALLLAPDSTLIALSPAAREGLGFRPLAEDVMLRQMKENAALPETARLVHEGQDPGVRALGERILGGERRFDHELGGGRVAVEVVPVPEIGFLVVGLAQR